MFDGLWIVTLHMKVGGLCKELCSVGLVVSVKNSAR
jgi:hypothetical protein